MGNSTPCKIVTPEIVILKLFIRDYDGEMTLQANLGFNRYTGGFSQSMRNITLLTLTIQMRTSQHSILPWMGIIY